MEPVREEGEEPGVAWVLGVFSHQQVHHFLGNGDLSDGILGFGAGHDEIVVCVLRGLLADRDGSLLHVQVRPLQSLQLAFSNPADQLQIEHS